MKMASHDTQQRLSQTLKLQLLSLPQTTPRSLSSMDADHLGDEHRPCDLGEENTEHPTQYEDADPDYHLLQGHELSEPSREAPHISDPSFISNLNGYYNDMEIVNLDQYHAVGQQNPQDFHYHTEQYMETADAKAETIHPAAMYEMDSTSTMALLQPYKNSMSLIEARPAHFTNSNTFTYYNQNDIYTQQYATSEYYSSPTSANHHNNTPIPNNEADLNLDQLSLSPSEPYAKLIYKCLLEQPDHTLVLQDIYTWFKLNTDKVKNPNDPKELGWKNSIRHNLSMNKAFDKVALPDSNGKQSGCVWRLAPDALRDGVQSTTRFRNKQPHKRTACPPSPHHDVRRKAGMAGGRQSKHNRTRQTYKRHATAKLHCYTRSPRLHTEHALPHQYSSPLPSQPFDSHGGHAGIPQSSFFGPTYNTTSSFYSLAVPSTPVHGIHHFISGSPTPTSAAWTPTGTDSSYLGTPSSMSEYTPEFTPEPQRVTHLLNMPVAMRNHMAMWNAPVVESATPFDLAAELMLDQQDEDVTSSEAMLSRYEMVEADV